MWKIVGSIFAFQKKGVKLLDVKRTTISDKALIFVHGLTGDAKETWRKDCSEPTLPELVAQDSELSRFAIYSFGYKSKYSGLGYDFRDLAKILLSTIEAQVKEKDIYIICHSMGGLIVQQLLIELCKNRNSLNSIMIRKVIYLSVPFNGSVYARIFGYIQSQAAQISKGSKLIAKLKDDWSKCVIAQSIPQLLLYGRGDSVVSCDSAQPSHMIGDNIVVRDVDEDHTSICKINSANPVYLLIKDFLNETVSKRTVGPLILWIHGTDQQPFSEYPDLKLDWSEHVDFNAKPRRLPTDEIWESKIIPDIKEIERCWVANKLTCNNIIRIYSKCFLSAALVIGTRLSFTKGVILEIDHYGEIWSSSEKANDLQISITNNLTNSHTSKEAVVVLSVSKDIRDDVFRYVNSNHFNIRIIVNIAPIAGTGSNSINGASSANAYAISVKDMVERLMSDGIETIHLFMNLPLGLSYLIGHRLTGVCSIQTYEYANPGFVPAYKL